MRSPRYHGPGFALRKDRDADGRRVWRARAWDGRGLVIAVDCEGRRPEVRAAAVQQVQQFRHGGNR